MTTDDTATAPDLAWNLDRGPLADALSAIDQAVAGIETAKATLTASRHDFARTLRDQILAHVDDESFADDLQRVVRVLYWEYGTLRLADLSAATGLDNDRLRMIAGPRRVEVACDGCRAPTEVLQTRRSGRPTGRCPDCRQPVADPFATVDSWDPPSPTIHRPVGVDWLDRLLDHLDARVPGEGCDRQLTLTRQWARREGMDQQMVVEQLHALGGYCDCEVLMNVRR